uniref:Uncharacterized protein n=1 Tax=Cacopsylla melanoneura TaxID=428564 RepID=A0A8D8WQS3_9HEMI
MKMIASLPFVLATTFLFMTNSLALPHPQPYPFPTGGHSSSWSISNLGPIPSDHGSETYSETRIYSDRSAAAKLQPNSASSDSSEEDMKRATAAKLELSPLDRSATETQQVVGYYLYPNQAYVPPAPPVAYYYTTTAYPTYIVY